MLKQYLIVGAVGFAIGGSFALSTPAEADSGVKTGVLTCNVDSGWGYILGSSKDIRCNYVPNHGNGEHYRGSISKVGLVLGILLNLH